MLQRMTLTPSWLTDSLVKAERPGHKYISKRPDGKGSWIYVYKREDGSTYTSLDKPVRDLKQWAATLRGARSRLNAAMADGGTPAQKEKLAVMDRQIKHVKGLLAAGHSHADDTHLPEEKPAEEKPKPARVEVVPAYDKDEQKTKSKAAKEAYTERTKDKSVGWRTSDAVGRHDGDWDKALSYLDQMGDREAYNHLDDTKAKQLRYDSSPAVQHIDKVKGDLNTALKRTAAENHPFGIALAQPDDPGKELHVYAHLESKANGSKPLATITVKRDGSRTVELDEAALKHYEALGTQIVEAKVQALRNMAGASKAPEAPPKGTREPGEHFSVGSNTINDALEEIRKLQDAGDKKAADLKAISLHSKLAKFGTNVGVRAASAGALKSLGYQELATHLEGKKDLAPGTPQERSGRAVSRFDGDHEKAKAHLIERGDTDAAAVIDEHLKREKDRAEEAKPKEAEKPSGNFLSGDHPVPRQPTAFKAVDETHKKINAYLKTGTKGPTDFSVVREQIESAAKSVTEAGDKAGALEFADALHSMMKELHEGDDKDGSRTRVSASLRIAANRIETEMLGGETRSQRAANEKAKADEEAKLKHAREAPLKDLASSGHDALKKRADQLFEEAVASGSSEKMISAASDFHDAYSAATKTANGFPSSSFGTQRMKHQSDAGMLYGLKQKMLAHADKAAKKERKQKHAAAVEDSGAGTVVMKDGKKHIHLATSSGSDVVPVEHHAGDWASHVRDDLGKKTFTITHIPSGLAIARGVNKTTAKDLVSHLSKHADGLLKDAKFGKAAAGDNFKTDGKKIMAAMELFKQKGAVDDETKVNAIEKLRGDAQAASGKANSSESSADHIEAASAHGRAADAIRTWIKKVKKEQGHAAHSAHTALLIHHETQQTKHTVKGQAKIFADADAAQKAKESGGAAPTEKKPEVYTGHDTNEVIDKARESAGAAIKKIKERGEGGSEAQARSAAREVFNRTMSHHGKYLAPRGVDRHLNELHDEHWWGIKPKSADMKKSVLHIRSEAAVHNAFSYDPSIRESFKQDGSSLMKGLYRFGGTNLGDVPDEYLAPYLDAFIEEAYEHESRETAHKPSAGEGDLAAYWARYVFNELVVYLATNPILKRAAKKLAVDEAMVASRLRVLRLACAPAVAQGDGYEVAGVGRIATFDDLVAYANPSIRKSAALDAVHAGFAGGDKGEDLPWFIPSFREEQGERVVHLQHEEPIRKSAPQSPYGAPLQLHVEPHETHLYDNTRKR